MINVLMSNFTQFCGVTVYIGQFGTIQPLAIHTLKLNKVTIFDDSVYMESS